MSFTLIDSVGNGGDVCTLKGLGELRKAAKGLSNTLALLDSGIVADDGERDAILRETAKKSEFDELRMLLRNGKAPFTLTDGVVDDDEGDDMNTDTTDKPKTGLRDALLRRKRAAKNASQLAMFSPSPCISKYAAGKRQSVAKNSGTSEGAVKGWQKRAHHLGWDILHRKFDTRFGPVHQAMIDSDEPLVGAPRGFHTEKEAIDHAKRVAQSWGAKNSGTSEGVRKAWQKRKHSGVALSGADLHEAVRDAHGYLKETLGKEPSHQDIADQLHHEHGIKVHPNKVRDIIAPSSSLDASVASLKPGATHHIGSLGDVKTWIERSGDGKKLRHVRQSGQSTSVIREWRHPSAVNLNTPLTGPGSWLHAQGAMTSAEADAAERQAVLRGRLIRHLNKAKRPKPMPTTKAG